MIRPILRWPDPVLSSVAEPVGEIDESIRTLVSDMFETMYDAPGRGLAAPQIGVLKRVFVMDAGWKDGARTPRVMIDPVIIATSDDSVVCEEGCLSIPGILAPIARPSRVTLAWRDEDGVAQEETLSGFEATCAQHEYDHLDGIVTFDRLDRDVRFRLEAEYSA